MEIIVGLGTPGCAIAAQFEQYKQYEVYKLSPKLTPGPNTFQFFESDHPEDYENSSEDLKKFLEPIRGKILFIVSGASTVSGATLSILEELHERCEINILYVKPEVELLGETKTLQENLVRNVLQQYARSGVFTRMFIVSNDVLAELAGDSSVYDHYKNINDLLVTTTHMINVLDHSDSVTDTYSPPHEVAKISTFGVVDAESGEERLFFPLDNIREAKYYFSVPEQDLKEDTLLYKTIVKQVKSKISGRLKVSYGIYQSVYKDKYVYLICHSSAIQKK